SRRRHTRLQGDWSSDVCSSDLSQRTTASDHNRGFMALIIPPNSSSPPLDAKLGLNQTAKSAGKGIEPVRAAGGTPVRAADGGGRSEERRVGKEGRCGGGRCE